MFALKNLPISRKLVLAFTVMVGVTAVTGALVFRQVSVAEAVRIEAQTTTDHRGAVDRLVRAMLEREVAATAAVRGDAPDAMNRFETAGADIARSLNILREATAEPVEAARISRLATLDGQYSDEVTDLVARAGVPATRADAEAALAASPGQEPMRSLVRNLADTGNGTIEAQEAALSDALAGVRSLLMIGLGLSLGVAALLCALLMRGIAAPTRSVARAMTKLSQGDLDITMKVLGRKDEVGAIAGAVEVFRQSLLRTRALEAQASETHNQSNVETSRIEDDRQKQLADQDHVVETLEEALTKLSAGDLTCRIEAEFPGRYARLRDEFNKAANHLHDMVGRVASSVSSIANGTNEIGHASDDLSRRTEQQAASLDKTASALDEITATVKHSAENAASVASSVAVARQDTERSGEVMREAVEAMTAIQKSSQQIARIIGVIDEIAFQTNLLALNAGVEAARAGDAGRGFAVVALEVRALAQRSSEAAKEIKTLIGASSTQVGNGVDLVNRSGEVLTRIAAQVTQIDALVQEIAGSAREQSIGIADVNDAVNKMDRVTQQNAAMVEETTAATLSLRTETEELGRLVASFRVDANDQAVVQLRNMAATMKAAVKPPVAAAPKILAPIPAAPRAIAQAAAPATAAAEDLGWEEF